MKLGRSRQLGLQALALAIGLSVALGCSKARPLASDVRRPIAWQEDVAAPLQANCTSCHVGVTPAGGYDTSDYLTAIGARGRAAGKPVVAVAGDANSLLLQKLDPAQASAAHATAGAKVLAGGGTLLALLQAWVVEGRLAFAAGTVHEGGILNPADADFHGKLLRNRKWDFAQCSKCHGADLSGGTAGVSCLQCHALAGGPTNCTTCHGQPPETGAHLAHVSVGALAVKLDCTECHLKPAAYNAPGHLLDAAGNLKTAALITFGTLASTSTAQRTGAPAFDGSVLSCSSVYCHGGAFTDTRAGNTTPAWDRGGGEATCGSCHGLPPSSHATTRDCNACHGQVAGPGLTIANKALHVDGKIQLGDGSGTCSACHGTSDSPAPPRDLSGNTDPSAITVGAHQAHLTASMGISAPITCDACHVVPTAVDSPGHLDHAGPATVTFSGLALTDQTAPTWDRTTASCSATYCHGGGDKLSQDTAQSRKPHPVWTAGITQAQCGSCHGVPPVDGRAEHVGVTLADCYKCHADTITPQGSFIFTGPAGARTTRHLNGVVDVALAH